MRGRTVAKGLMLLAGLPVGAAAQDTAPQVKVGGVVYAHYLYQLADEADGTNNFDIARAYINVLGSLPGGIATRVTGDIYRVADGSLAYRLKYAYGAYTPEGSPITLKLGQMQTPWIEFEEAMWDYRMQGTVALDRNAYMSSSDFGAGLDGMWGEERISAQFGVYNGEANSGENKLVFHTIKLN